MTDFNYVGDALTIEQAKRDALQKIAGHQESIDANIATIKDEVVTIREKVALIEQHQKCICECCTAGAARGELLVETNMQNPDKTAPERHDLYEQELIEAGQKNYGDQ